MSARIITGLILAPIVIAITWIAPESAGLGLVFLGAVTASHELLGMSGASKLKFLPWFGALWTAGFPMLAALAPQYLLYYFAATPLAAMAPFLIWTDRIPDAYSAVTSFGFSVLYVGGLLSFPAMIARSGGFAGPALLVLFAVVWMGDTAAYFGGKYTGKHKLHPKVSPKKTIEGSIWGVIGSVVGALFIDFLFTSPFGFGELVAIGLLGGVLEQVGDLSESVLKRSANVKDSGTLLPGHGGMLDRIDGLLFAGPIVFFFLAS